MHMNMKSSKKQRINNIENNDFEMGDTSMQDLDQNDVDEQEENNIGDRTTENHFPSVETVEEFIRTMKISDVNASLLRMQQEHTLSDGVMEAVAKSEIFNIVFNIYSILISRLI